jgi:hypothetical protein
MASPLLGRVGIGTDTPSEKLEVAGNMRINNHIIYLKHDNSHGLGYYNIFTTTGKYANKTVDGPVLFGWNGGALGTDQTITGGTKNIALTWSANGNVGIGIPEDVNSNSYKLAVNGIIGAKELKIEINSTIWPDYVFEKDYSLMHLSELEQFLKSNKHLPNIPSSQDVKNNNGVLIGDLQTKLLQKIEELTLYIIEQNKKVEEQNKMLEEQNTRLLKLEKTN